MTAIVFRIACVRFGLALLAFAALVLAFGPAARAADASPATLAMTGFELLEDHPDASRHDAQQARLKLIEDEFRAQVQQRGLYTLVDNAPHQALIERVRGGVEFLYRCPHCLAEIGTGIDDYFGSPRLDHRYYVSFAMLYKLSREIQFKTEVRHDWLRSNLPNVDWDATLVTVGVRLQR